MALCIRSDRTHPTPGSLSDERPSALRESAGDRPRAAGTVSRRARRRMLFAVLDCLFLAAIGMISVVAMHHAHTLEWPFLVEMFIGMAGAMILQVTLAVLVAPLLGSIESMVPSMVVAMLAPMVLCGPHVIGCRPEWLACLAVGAGLGIAAFLLLSAYGVRCRRVLAQIGGSAGAC